MSNPEGKVPADAKDFKFPDATKVVPPVTTHIDMPVEKQTISKFTEGQFTNRFGKPDDFNEDFQTALESGWIDRNSCWTKLGAEKFGQPEEASAVASHKSQRGLEAPASATPITDMRTAIKSSSTARRENKEAGLGALGEKKLLDSIQLVLEERGFNILGISAELKEVDSSGGEIYTLSIEFGPTGGNGTDKKQKKTLRLVGSEESLVDSLSRNDFNFPITTDVKKIRRAFKR